MKLCLSMIFILFGAILAIPTLAAQKADSKAASVASVPKYDPAAEAIFKGTVAEVKDRECPVSGGMGSHVMLKMADGKTIEVHLASSKWVKVYELTFNPGDQIEVTGVKVQLEGVDTILAREVKRGNDVFTFRDKDGKPAW